MGLSLLALALACSALWLTWRVVKRPVVNGLPLYAFPLFPAFGSDFLPRILRTLEHGGTLGFFDALEAVMLTGFILYLCFAPSGFRSLRKGAR